ncbi:unnamed protein product, partial [Musa textilis]
REVINVVICICLIPSCDLLFFSIFLDRIYNNKKSYKNDIHIFT